MNNNWFIIIGMVCIAILVVFILFTKGSSISGYSVKTEEDKIKIPLSEISETAKFYEYVYDGKTIRYFVVKSDDGSIKTGFDACDVCYKFGKGYRQEGKYLVCNNCGRKFPISGLGTENKNPGGCWPGYLPSSVDGDNLVIKKSDLEKGKWRFR